MSKLRWGQLLVWALATFLIWQSAWLSDDSLITIRTALNWGSGYGPYFNIDEAVQPYTHPLWFLLITLVGTVTGSWIYAVLYLNIVCAAIGILLLLRRTSNLWQLVTVGLVVVLGNTALDWSTSGLEGGLSIMLLAILTSQPIRARPALWGVTVGLILLCRLDFALLLAPWAAVYWWALKGKRPRLLASVAVVAPLLMWAVWAQITYGAILPATFQAKTNSEIPTSELVSRGWEYVSESLAYDPILILVAVALVPVLWIAGDLQSKAWVVGVLGYCAYVVAIGGDYMLGRFLIAPLFVCLLELTRTGLPRPAEDRTFPSVSLLWGLTCAAAILGVLNTRAFDWRITQVHYDPNRPYLADERIGWTGWGRSLNPFGAVERRPAFYPTDLAFLTTQTDNWPVGSAVTQDPVVVCPGLGAMGMFVGPQVHVIDPCGLTDRFMASLSYTPTGQWKAGHFERPLPDGYLEAVKYRDATRVRDPALAAELQELWQVIGR